MKILGFRWSVNVDMFNKTYRLGLLVISVFILASCDEKEISNIPPYIWIHHDSGYIVHDSVISPGEKMSFKIGMNSGTKSLTNFFISVENDQGIVTRLFDTAMYQKEFTWEGSFFKNPELLETWTFEVRDREGLFANTSLVISAGTNAVYGQIVSLENVVLAAPDNPNTQPGFYSLQNYSLYSGINATANQQIIDLLYYYSGEDENVIASPGANIEEGVYPSSIDPGEWEIRNTSRFTPTDFTADQFKTIENDSLMVTAYVDANGKRKAKNLEVGDVFVFKIEDGRLGFFYVDEVIGTNEGQIQIDIKIQEAK